MLLLLVNIFCFRVNLCRLLFRLSPFLHPFAKLILYMCLFYFLSVWRFRFSSRRMQKRNENPPDIRTFRCWQFLCNGIRARQRLRSVRNREIDCVRARGEERSTHIQRESWWSACIYQHVIYICCVCHSAEFIITYVFRMRYAKWQKDRGEIRCLSVCRAHPYPLA